MNRYFMLLACLLMLIPEARAQFNCGTDLLHQRQLQLNPGYQAAFDRNRQEWKQWQQMKQAGKMTVTGTDTTFEIPIVFHILHFGQAEGTIFNPAHEIIDSLVSYLNRSWAATWVDYPKDGAGGTRMPLRFKLAQRDPDCNPTDGIVRIDASVLPNYKNYGVNYDNSTPAPSDSAIKSLSRWPSGDYYNIWVVNYIDGPSGRIAGYAYYPIPLAEDGTVITIRSMYFSTGSDSYYAITHEMGHAFYLMHTFEGSYGSVCPDDTDCTVNGDWICDTEPHVLDAAPCHTPTDINPCTGMAYQGVQYNFMNYSCVCKFTPLQRERVSMAMHKYRSGLLTSLGAVAPDPGFIAPATACVPGIDFPRNKKNAGPYDVDLGDMTAYSYGLSGDSYKAYMDRTCLQQAHLVKGKSYPLTISTSSDEPDSLSVRVWIDYNNNGTFEPAELVYTHDGTRAAHEVHSGMIAVPAAGIITAQPLRMRVIADVNGAPLMPCANLWYGQAEDYTVVVASNETSSPDAALQYDVQVTPNPATNAVSVKAAYPVNVTVCGMDGRVRLHQDNGLPIDISMLAEGMYILKITGAADGQLIKTEKLVKAAR